MKKEESCRSKKCVNKTRCVAAGFSFKGDGAASVSNELSGTLMANSRMHVITSMRKRRNTECGKGTN